MTILTSKPIQNKNIFMFHFYELKKNKIMIVKICNKYSNLIFLNYLNHIMINAT